ncbi:Fic family protein [Bacillaceae bacterium OS4b]|nr:Fic family protein [Bacillaceae bacterium OS4b]
MINKLTQLLRSDYSSHRYYKAEQLAKRILIHYYNGAPPNFPIDIFKMLKDFGVFYEFRDLDKLEGAYSPEGKDYPAAVLLNVNRPFSRQRFTTAHELCHHIKDYDNQILCPQSSRSPIEKYANEFANSLLMPEPYFSDEARKLVNDEGFIEPEDAFTLCHIFGTSYTAVMWKLYFKKLLSFKPDGKFFNRAKASKKLGRVGNLPFLKNIIDNYEYFPPNYNNFMWLKFQNELVFNDSRLEGLDINIEETSEMLTDLRFNGNASTYYQIFSGGNRPEVIGHSYIYRYVSDKDYYPDRYEILEIHKLLFSLSPFAADMGRFRRIDNAISGAVISTTRWDQIEYEIHLVSQDIKYLYEVRQTLSISDYVSRAVNIHHRLTQIHPFEDGNGRIIRAILNWLLKLKSLPPIYIPYESKDEYVDALTEADQWNNEAMEILFLKRLLSSFIQLNDEFSLILEDDIDFNRALQEK